MKIIFQILIFRLTIVLSLLLISFSGYAQNTQISYSIVNSNSGSHGIKTFDNGYIFCGAGFLFTGKLACIVKVDSFLDLQWTRTFEDVNIYQIRQTSDSNYITAGGIPDSSTFYVTKLDQNGNTIWKKDYDLGLQVDIHSIEETNDHGFILSGDIGYMYSFPRWEILIKLDTAGNTSWIKYLVGSAFAFAKEAHNTSDGGYILAGNFSTTSYNYTGIHLSKFDDLGNHIWSKTYNTVNNLSPVSISQTLNNGFILTSRGVNGATLIRTDSLGNTLWVKSYGGNSFVSIKQLPDSGFIACGLYNTQFWAMRIDSSGNVIWSKEYGDAGQFTSGSSVEVSNDDLLVMVGAGVRAASTDYYLYFITTDFSGTTCFEINYNIQATSEVITVTSDTPQVNIVIPVVGTSAFIPFIGPVGYYPSCSLTPIEQYNLQNEIQISPNPAKQLLIITSGYILQSISIFNILGKKMSVNHILTDNINLDISFLPPGIYFLQAETENGVATKKFIVNH